MTVRAGLMRVGAATVFVGLTIAAQQCPMAYADDGIAADSAAPAPVRQATAGRPAAPPHAARRGAPSAAAAVPMRRTQSKPAAPAGAAKPPATASATASPDTTPALPTVAATPAVRASAPARPAAGLPAAVVPAAPSPAPVPAVVPHRAAATASVTSIGTGLNQLLTATANLLAHLPGGPVSDLLQGAVHLVRRSLFPTSVGVVTKPVIVPLALTDVSGGPNQKLGIYITLGSGATPAIFELDTGGAGIYGAYASEETENSPWWGNGAVTTSTPVSVNYDSGNSYTGNAANTQVYLYAPGGTTPLLATARTTVGQMDSISNKGTPLWTPTGLPEGKTTPPIEDAFYGDFGLAQQYSKNDISNVLAQLIYTNGVSPGYRIHVDKATKTAWLQIGLTPTDLQDPAAAYFPEVADPNAPSWARNPYSGIPYYSPQVFNANIKISTTGTDAGTVVNTVNTGMTADTGAATTLHNTNLTPLPVPTQYAAITDDGNLQAGLNFNVTGTTVNGAQAPVFNFTTVAPSNEANIGVVEVQNNRPGNTNYYLNTGIYMFYLNDVVYSLGTSIGGALIGLISHQA